MWRNHKVLFSSGLAILLLWIVAGACLYFSGDDNFMSDLFSAGSAIGTVGAVITSLYLSNREFNYQQAFSFSTFSTIPKNCQNKYWIAIRNNTDFEIHITQIEILYLNKSQKEMLPNGNYLPIAGKKITHLEAGHNSIDAVEKLIVETNIGKYEVTPNGSHKYYLN